MLHVLLVPYTGPYDAHGLVLGLSRSETRQQRLDVPNLATLNRLSNMAKHRVTSGFKQR